MAREIILADSGSVSLNDPSAGRTRVTLSSITYNTGTDELLVFHNTGALVLGVDYTEEDSTHVIFEFLPDATGPDVDIFEFNTITVGSSLFIPPPTTFLQVNPAKRPDNFGGRFIFP